MNGLLRGFQELQQKYKWRHSNSHFRLSPHLTHLHLLVLEIQTALQDKDKGKVSAPREQLLCPTIQKAEIKQTKHQL